MSRGSKLQLKFKSEKLRNLSTLLLVWSGGCVSLMILRLSQPSLAGIGAGVELGHILLQDMNTPEQNAEQVVKYILDENLKEAVEYCPKSKSFKLKLKMTTLPPLVSRALKGCTKESVLVFGGAKGRVRVLPANLLEGKILSDMKALGQSSNFTDAVIRMLEERDLRMEQMGRDFYKQIR